MIDNSLLKLGSTCAILLGILLAMLFLLVPIGAIFKLSTLLVVVAGGSLIVSPIWWIWSGLTLRKSAS